MKSSTDQSEIIDEISQAFIDMLSNDENIRIILMYGSRVNGTASPKSDVEYIAITEEEDRFDIEFLYKGIPADLWSTSWKWIEKLANREDMSMVAPTSYILGKVIFARNEADRKRFDALVAEINRSEKYHDMYLDSAIQNYHGIKDKLGSLLLAKKYNQSKFT